MTLPVFATYLFYGMGAFVLFLWLYNLVLAARRKPESVPARRLMFSLALAAVLLSIYRSSVLYGTTVAVANVIVLFSIAAAFIRTEKKPDKKT